MGDNSTDFIGGNSFTTTTHQYGIGTYQLKFIVTGANGCLDTTNYKVFIGGNPAVGLGNPGNTAVCTGSSLTFPVTNTQSNPPGTIYTVHFNDGSPDKVYTSAPDTIIHFFNKSSCGTTSGSYTNSFSATITASNPCSSSEAVVSPIYVSEKPKASFTASKDVICINSSISFTSNSQGNDVSNAGCKDNVKVWKISPATGWTFSSGKLGDDLGQSSASLWDDGSKVLNINFTTKGTYTIQLQVGGTKCGNDIITKTVCVNPAPVAGFTTNVTSGCGPLTVKATNTSPLPTCGDNTYRWSVSPASGFVFANGTTATSVNPEITFNAAGNYTLSLVTSNSNGECSSSPTTKNITVTVKPVVSVINASSSVCEGGTTSPTTSVSSAGTTTYLWTFEGGSPSTSTQAVPGTITYLTPGTFNTTLAVTNECGTTIVTRSIVVSAKPTVNQPVNYQFCAGDPSGLISFTGSSGATFRWTNNNTAIGLGSSGTGNITFTTRNITNAPFVATITVTPEAGCIGSPVTFTITVNPRPTIATTGPDAQTCATSFQLTGNVPSVGTGSWVQTEGLAAAIGNINAPNATVSGLIKGTRYKWAWTISGTGCPSSTKVFTLDVLSDLTNTIKSDFTAVCPGQNVQLTSQTLSGGDIPGKLSPNYGYTWESSINGTDNWVPVAGGSTATITVTPSSNIFYRRKVRSYGQCEVISNIIGITMNAAVPAANAGSPITLCSQTQAQLNANDPGINFTGTWTDETGGASNIVFSPNANAYNATVSGLVPGKIYKLRWTINSMSCGSTASTITITNLAPIVNSVKTDVTAVCPGQGAQLSSQNLSGGDVPGVLAANYNYVWESSVNGTDNWMTVPGGNTQTLTVIPSANSFYRRKVRSYGQCEVISNVISITMNAAVPAANAGSPITLCNQTQAQLYANDPGINFTGMWTDDTGGTSNLVFTPNANAYNATVSGLVPGRVYRLRWTIASVSCGATSSVVTITDLAPITNGITPVAATICFGQNVSLSGPAPTGGTGSYTYLWESSPDQANWSVITGQTGANLIAAPSSSTFYRRSVFSGSCSSISNIVRVNVLPPISDNNISGAQQLCIGQPIVLLNGTVPTGGDGVNYTYQWQQSADNFNWVNISAGVSQTYQPAGLTQTTYFRRLASSAVCSGAQQSISNSIRITINPNAKAEFTASTTTGCIPFNLKNVISGVPHDDVNSSYTWLANGTVIGTGATFPGYIINADGVQVVIKLVTVSKFGCDTSSMSKTFTTTQLVTASFSKDQTVGCGPLTTRFSNISTPLGSASYVWNFGNGSTSAQIQPGAVVFQPNPSGRDTTYIITLRATTSCGISSCGFYRPAGQYATDTRADLFF